MAVDPNRAALILKEYRYITRENDAIRAKFGSNTREIIVDTNLDEAGANDFADWVFGQTSRFSYVFDVEIEGVLRASDLIGSPPRYNVSFSRHPHAKGTYTLIAAKTDPLANHTTLTVRSE